MLTKVRNFFLKLGLASTPIIALSFFSPVLASMFVSVFEMFMTIAKVMISTVLPIIIPIVTKIAGNLAHQLVYYSASALAAFYGLSLMTKLSLGLLSGLLLLNGLIMLTPRPHPKTMDINKAYLDGDVDRVKELSGLQLAPMQMPLYNHVKRRTNYFRSAEEKPPQENLIKKSKHNKN